MAKQGERDDETIDPLGDKRDIAAGGVAYSARVQCEWIWRGADRSARDWPGERHSRIILEGAYLPVDDLHVWNLPVDHQRIDVDARVEIAERISRERICSGVLGSATSVAVAHGAALDHASE